MRILIAEDDTILTDGLSRALRKSGYAVDCVDTGTRADAALSAQTYDAVILDLGLPGISGFEVLKRLRSRGGQGAGADPHGRGFGRAAGARPRPRRRRLHGQAVLAVGTRGAGAGDRPPPCRLGDAAGRRIGNLTFDQAGRVARVSDRNVELSAREIGLLEILIQRAGRLVSKEQIVDHLCEWGEEVSHNAIEVYVHRLRKKIEDSDVVISTVRGLGYCLQRPAAPDEAPSA